MWMNHVVDEGCWKLNSENALLQRVTNTVKNVSLTEACEFEQIIDRAMGRIVHMGLLLTTDCLFEWEQ